MTDRLTLTTPPWPEDFPPTVTGAVGFTLHRADGRHIVLRHGGGILFAAADPDHAGRMRPRTLLKPTFRNVADGWEILAGVAGPDGRPLDPARIVAYSSRDLVDWRGPLPVDGPVSDVAVTTIPVTPETADRLERRFGRVYNVGIDVDEGGPANTRGATLHYNDGSSRRVAVTWSSAEGEDTLRGEVDILDVPFPWIADRADPQVFAYRGRWYFVGTPDAGEGNQATPALLIRGADTLDGLPTALDHEIVQVGESGIEGCFWAPEVHHIGSRLVILFAPSIGTASWDGVQCHLMQLIDGGDPLRPDHWSSPRPILTRGGALLREDGRHGISLDMTYISDGHQHVYVWSQRVVDGGFVGDAELWVAAFDPTDPATLTTDPRRLHNGVRSWELTGANVVEGPYLLGHGDDLFLVYAAAAVGPHYATGALHARRGAHLADPDSWTPVPYPVLDSYAVDGQWGPGHVSFFAQGDDDIMAFHAKARVDEDARHAGLRRVHWAADGRPVLDMTANESVHPDFRTVTTRKDLA